MIARDEDHLLPCFFYQTAKDFVEKTYSVFRRDASVINITDHMQMVNGKILYEDGQFFISEEPQEIYKKANEIVSRMK